MIIAIPSINRVSEQPTIEVLPAARFINLVVPEHQRAAYMGKYGDYNTKVIGHPDDLTNIGEVRHWILEQFRGEKVLMMDDDLVFFKRRSDEPDKFTNAYSADLDAMLRDCDYALDTHCHIAVATREGGNRNTDDFIINSRGLRVLGYDTEKVLNAGVRFNRIPVMEDFDITLQLMRKGYPNCIVNRFVHNQAHGSGASGGCSTYRTLELQAKAAHALQALHPEFVTVVKKKTKTAWGGVERTDVRIQWKKAYESSLA